MEFCEVEGDVFFESKYSISVELRLLGEENVEKWLLTNVYGPLDFENQKEFISELNQIRTKWAGQWMLIGDFNITRFQQERSGNCRGKKASMLFNCFINDQHLIEIKSRQRQYTWSNLGEIPIMENWIDVLFQLNG